MTDRPAMERPLFALQPVDAYLGRLGAYGVSPPASGPFAVSVIASKNASKDFAKPVRLDLVTNPSGNLISFNQARGDDGILRRPFFAAGTYDLLLESPIYRPTQIEGVNFAASDDPANARTGRPVTERVVRNLKRVLQLEPGIAYPFPNGRVPGLNGPTLLRGSIQSGETNAAGYLVQVLGAVSKDVTPYTTSADGQWLLVFPIDQEDARISYRIVSPSGQKKTFSNVKVTAGASVTTVPYVVGNVPAE